MSPIEKRAYWAWLDAKKRCTNPKANLYNSYGGKGIKIFVSSKRFVTWYVQQVEKINKWKCPTVDRIDPNKGYCFCNIQVLEKSENIARMCRANFKKRIRLINVFKKGENTPFFVAFGTYNAAELFKKAQGNVWAACKSAQLKRPKIKKADYNFEFLDI